MTVVAARYNLAGCIWQDAYPCSSVLQLEGCFLLFEAPAIDAVTTTAIALHDITPLAHKPLHDAMEWRALVVQPLPALFPLSTLPSAQAPEVLYSLGRLRNAGRQILGAVATSATTMCQNWIEKGA